MKSKTETIRADNWDKENDIYIWRKSIGIALSVCLVLYWGFMAFDDFVDNLEWESKYNYVYFGERADRNEYFQIKDWPEFSLDSISDCIDTGETVINRRFVNLGLSCLEVSGTPGDYEIIEASYAIVLPRFMYFPLFGTAIFSYYDGDWGENCSFEKEFGRMTKRNGGPGKTIHYPITDEVIAKYRKIAMEHPEWGKGMEPTLVFRPERIEAWYYTKEDEYKEFLLEKDGVLQQY